MIALRTFYILNPLSRFPQGGKARKSSYLSVLCDPLWFNELYFTTKDTKVFTKVTKDFFYTPLGEGLKRFLITSNPFDTRSGSIYLLQEDS
jgi:hypothetical protein